MHLPRQLRSLFWTALLSLTAAAPATGPAKASPPQTGEITLTFTQRSPLSSRKEIARRLGCPESVLRDDYDITTYPFRVYVPHNYNPSIPYGVFVYLGNHDVNTVAPLWEPVFDKAHMIYITPDWHSPMQVWALIGLGFDAVDNLKRLYNIDSNRLYDMWFGSVNLDIPLACADVYTGMLFGREWQYFRRVNLPDRKYMRAEIPPPRADLLQKAREHGVVLITLNDEPANGGGPAIAMALKQDGFTHVLNITEPVADVHYPNYAAGWIADPVLPFLDKAAKQAAATPTTRPSDATRSGASTAGVSPAGTSPAGTSPSGNANAQHLLNMARLFIQNGDTEQARAKLQAILAGYPHDPAAVPAKKLLDSLPPPPPPPQ